MSVSCQILETSLMNSGLYTESFPSGKISERLKSGIRSCRSEVDMGLYSEFET